MNYEAGRIVSHHAKIVKEKDDSFGAPTYRVGDPSIVSRNPVTGTSIQLEYIFNGIPIIAGNNDVSAGILRLKGYLTGTVIEGRRYPKLFICRNCVNLIWEMKKYRWKKWAHKQLNYERNSPEEPVKKDDHACDALRYGIASRPEVDDGASVPPAMYPGYGSEAIDIGNPVVDREIVSTGRKYTDYTLGEDY